MSDEDNVVQFQAAQQPDESMLARDPHNPNRLDMEVLMAMQVLDSWAVERLQAACEPPWTYYRLMQLREALRELRGPRPDEIEVNLPA